MYARSETPDQGSYVDEDYSGDESHVDSQANGEGDEHFDDEFAASPVSYSGASVSSRFAASPSLSQSPFPLHASIRVRNNSCEDHVVWKGTAVLVKIGTSTFSSVKCSSEPMRCHISSQFIWFIRSASRPSSGIPVDIFTFRDVSSTLALQTFEFYDGNLKRLNYILVPNRDEYLAFANTLQSLGIRVSHVSLGSWLHKQNPRGVWQLRWAALDDHGKLNYWRSRPSSDAVAPAGSIDLATAVVRFSESSPRAGVFTVKSNQKEVAFQADTLEAAVQWVKELKEVSLEKEEDYESHQHLSALSTPFTDQYKQIMYTTHLPPEDEFSRALDAANEDDSEVDEAMIDEEALLLEVEQEERAQQFKIKNQQNNGVSAFSRIFQRDTPGVASSYPSYGANIEYHRDSPTNMRPMGRGNGMYRDDDERSQYSQYSQRSLVQPEAPVGRQGRLNMRAVGAFARAGKVRASRRPVMEEEEEEEEEVPYVEPEVRGRGRLAAVGKQFSTAANAVRQMQVKGKQNCPPPVEDDEENLPPPSDDDDAWNAPPPSGGKSDQRNDGFDGMPPPPDGDDDDMPPPPDFEEDEPPPPVVETKVRRSRRQ